MTPASSKLPGKKLRDIFSHHFGHAKRWGARLINGEPIRGEWTKALARYYVDRLQDAEDWSWPVPRPQLPTRSTTRAACGLRRFVFLGESSAATFFPCMGMEMGRR